jgi:GTP-binding protein Era
MTTIYSLIRNAANSQGGKFALVLNKVDLIKPKSELIDIAQRFGTLADRVVMEKIQQQQRQQQQQKQQSTTEKNNMETEDDEDWMPEIFYTCAKQGHKDEGVQDVLQYLLDQATPNEWLLPSAHQVTPMDYKARVEEIIREKIYRTLHRELPHQIKQRNRQLELIRGDSPQSSIMMIQQDLMVYTKSHQNLLHNSHKSGNLQRIHDTALPELRQLFQCEVLLSLNVKLIKRNRR